ncbi:MAG: tail fiber domain-containing protein [Alphaproteobacteria bacterium]|nr:tail fiber domain-containing protein [Alphaproteobacteria bacterium]
MRATAFTAVLAVSPSAFATCSSPSGNAGDIGYSSTSNTMAYCNGTGWIAMAAPPSLSTGTLTSGDFCTATSGSAIQCTTAAINLATQVTGTLPIGNGGTGQTSLTTNGIIYGQGTSASLTTAAGSQYNVLVAGVAGVPAFGQVNLAQSAAVSGILASANGGTGVNNSYNITLGGAVNTAGALTTSGAYSLTLTTTGATNVTLPTSGTLLSSTVTTLSSLTSIGTVTSGTWTANMITVPYGGTGAGSFTQYGVLLGNGTGALGVTPVGTAGTVLAGQGSANPIFTPTPSLTNLTLSGAEMLSFGTAISTTGISTALPLTASAYRYAGAGTATFESIAAGTTGQVLYLHNASTSALTIADQSDSTDATVANRIITGTGGDIVLPGNSSTTLQYDGTTSRWRVTGSSGVAVAGGSDKQVLYNNSGAMVGTANFAYDYTNTRLGVGTSTPGYALDAYTGTVAGQVMHVGPQAVSVTGAAYGGVVNNNGTTGQLAYYSGASAISGAATAYWDATNTRLSIGTAVPATSLDVYDSTMSSIRLTEANAGLGGAAVFLGRKSEGTLTSPTQVLANEALTGLYGEGYTSGSAFSAATVDVRLWAAENYTSTANGSYITFDTTPIGTTAKAEVMRIDSTGYVGIGTTNPYYKLHVDGGQIELTTTDYNSTTTGSNIYFNLGATTGDTYGILGVAKTGGTAVSNLAIMPYGGYVGIGSTSPVVPLDVNGAIAIPNNTYYRGRNTGGTLISLLGVGNDNNTYVFGQASSDVIMGPGGSETARFKSNGNVGIGTTAQILNGKLSIYGATAVSSGMLTMLNSGAATKSWSTGPDSNGNYIIYDGASAGMYMTYGATAWTASSDRRIKTNIQPLTHEEGLGAIEQLNPVTFNWRDPKASKTTQVGVLAQDVQKVLPEIVDRGGPTSYTPDGTLGVQYTGLIAPLIKAVQELKALFDGDHTDITKLKAENDTQAKAIEELKRDFESYKKAHP